MSIINMFLGSAVFMWFVAFVCAVFCIRCLTYGVMGGTSTLLRILCTLLFAALAYYCWQRAGTLHGANAIDSFIYDSWAELKQMLGFFKTKF